MYAYKKLFLLSFKIVYVQIVLIIACYITDTQFTSEANEKTDEGMVSIKQIKEACLEGNIEHFTCHLEKEIGPRHHLLMRSDNNGWNVLHVAAKGGNLKIFRKLVSENLNICQKHTPK